MREKGKKEKRETNKSTHPFALDEQIEDRLVQHHVSPLLSFLFLDCWLRWKEEGQIGKAPTPSLLYFSLVVVVVCFFVVVVSLPLKKSIQTQRGKKKKTGNILGFLVPN